MRLNRFGRIVEQEWLRSFKIRNEIKQDEYVIMPNHFHAIVWIGRSEASPLDTIADNVRKPQSLSSLVSGFKGAVTRQIKLIRGTDEKFWQRNYYEHLIRNEDDLHKIRYYIRTNPENWSKDSLYNAN